MAWKDLEEANQAVLRALLVQLHACLSNTNKKQDRRDPGDATTIESPRPRNTFLIDGDRGVGKTTVLLTLLDALRPTPIGINLGAKEGEPLPGETPAELRTTLGTLRERAIAVGPIELSTQIDNTDLLVLIGMHIRAVVSGPDDPSMARDDLDAQRWVKRWAYNEQDPCAASWKKLLAAIASGWDGSVVKARSNEDPEAHARRLSDATESKLDLRRLWCAFIDDVLKHRQVIKHRLHPDEPWLIVIGIDDADLNPQHHDRLLQHLPLLQHPSLAFVLTGDHEQFVQMSLRRFRKVMGSAPGPDETRTLRRMAVEHVEKVMPSPHRHRVAAPNPDDGVRRLEAVMRRIVLPRLKLKAPGATPTRQRKNAASPGVALAFEPMDLFDLFALDPMCRRILPASRRRLEALRIRLEEAARGVVTEKLSKYSIPSLTRCNPAKSEANAKEFEPLS